MGPPYRTISERYYHRATSRSGGRGGGLRDERYFYHTDKDAHIYLAPRVKGAPDQNEPPKQPLVWGPLTFLITKNILIYFAIL